MVIDKCNIYGTISSCTEQAFVSILNTYDESDIINFNCAPSSYCNSITIYLTQTFWISKNVTIDGAIHPGSKYKIILDGEAIHRQFIIADTNTTWVYLYNAYSQ